MQLTEEQKLIQDMAKNFAQQQIKPYASEWDQKVYSLHKHCHKWDNWALWEC